MPHKPKPKKSKQAPPKPKTTVVAAPVSKSVRKTATKPKMQNSANGVEIEHTEYFMDVTSSSSNFQAFKVPINPGMVIAFPWLSSVAARFESYLFERLEFMYKPMCSTTTPGVVILAVDYDAIDMTPTSKVVANSYAESSSSSVWDTNKHFCKGSNLRKFGIQRYVRSSDELGTDLRTSDVGNLFICISNTPAATTQLGEVWVSYKIRLFTPQITSSNILDQSVPHVPPGYAQAMRLRTVGGEAIWTGEFFNNAIAAIQQVWTEPNTDLRFDIVFNPSVMGRRFLTFLDTNGGTFGVPPGLIEGASSVLRIFRGLSNWYVNAFAGSADRIFLLDFGSNDNGSTTIPSIRFSYNTTQDLNPQFMMLQYDGPFPESPLYNLNTITGPTTPTQNNVNWGALLAQAIEGRAHFEQKTDSSGVLITQVNGKVVQTTTLLDTSELIDSISLDD